MVESWGRETKWRRGGKGESGKLKRYPGRENDGAAMTSQKKKKKKLLLVEMYCVYVPSTVATQMGGRPAKGSTKGIAARR